MTSRRSSRLQALLLNSLSVVEPKPGTGKRDTGSGRKRKVESQNGPEKPSKDGFAMPSTPKKHRVSKALPCTPTPAAVGLMAVPYSSGDIDDNTPPPRRKRAASPHATNAPLISPETSRLITNKPLEDLSPSKSSNIKTTTANILEEACAHLVKVDPRLKPVIEKHHCRIFSEEGLGEEIDPFRSLASGIISQQVSGAAAKAIKTRFVALFHPDSSSSETETVQLFPTPLQVAAADITLLRTAGLSQRKAEYVKGLAEKFASGELSADMLFRATYDEVLEKLIAVRGLGKWSVEMFACFGLKRLDVFSTGDLGVQRGMAAFSGKDVSKLKAKGGGKWKYMPENDMLEMAEKFAPYRSVFMWYMWRVEDVDVGTMED